MATRLVYLCEICLDAGQETPARPVYVLVDERGAVVDLCDDHRARVLDPVERLIVDHGRPADDGKGGPRKGARKGPGQAPMIPVRGHANEWPCPGPGCAFRAPFSVSHQLQKHMVEAHGGLTIPAVNAAIIWCRIPGCGFGPSTAAGIAVHAAAVHSMPNLPTMIFRLSQSDPEAVEDLLSMFWNVPDDEDPDTQGMLV